MSARGCVWRALASAGLGLAAVGGGLAGCAADPTVGYAFAPTRDDSIASIAVPIFDNATFYPGVETRLTAAIVAEIQRTTDWAVVDERRAETILTGVVRSVEQRPLSYGRITGMVEEVGLSVTVDFDWEDPATGRSLVSRRSFTASTTFVPARPSGESVERGLIDATERLAREIVRQLRSAW